MERVSVIDSHTGGEPTRVVTTGGPDLGRGPLADAAKLFRDRFDAFRSRVVNEPRGSDALVGAILCEPHDASCVAGVIFFDREGRQRDCHALRCGGVRHRPRMLRARRNGNAGVGSREIGDPLSVVPRSQRPRLTTVQTQSGTGRGTHPCATPAHRGWAASRRPRPMLKSGP